MGETDVLKESEEKDVKIEKDVDDKKPESNSDAKVVDSDAASKDPSELELKIIRQIEYYFGDHNLIKDKFLQGQLTENDGWVAISVLVTFNRLKALSDDGAKILAAIKKSENNLIEISEDESKIRRSLERPLPEKPENWKEEQVPRTVYVKGFPVDSTLDQLTDFFKEHGSILNVFMKKKPNSKSFKGSVFATFSTPEEAETFFKIEGQKYKTTLLIKEMKVDYVKRKEEEYVKRKEEREKRKQEKNEEDPVKAYPFNPEEDVVKGCLIKLSGFSRGTTREHIKDVFSRFAKVAYIEFRIGDEEGVIRFEEAGVAKSVLEKALTGEGDAKRLVINGADIANELIEGEAELEYWNKLVQARGSNKDRRTISRRGRGANKSRGRGDYRGRGGRGRGGSRDRYFDRRDDRDGHDRKRPAQENNGETSGATPVKQEKTDDAPPNERKRPAEESNDCPPLKQEKVETS